jgi:hypothetical protein
VWADVQADADLPVVRLWLSAVCRFPSADIAIGALRSRRELTHVRREGGSSTEVDSLIFSLKFQTAATTVEEMTSPLKVPDVPNLAAHHRHFTTALTGRHITAVT